LPARPRESARRRFAIPAYDATVCLVRSCGDVEAGPLLTLPEPARRTAAGKVLMAHREPWCRSILALPLMGCTEGTVTDLRLLEQELERIRVDCNALADGEHVDGCVTPTSAKAPQMRGFRRSERKGLEPSTFYIAIVALLSAPTRVACK
jgi:hypothetical protein